MVSRHLPGEIIEDILIKLPGKSICRFKSLSKSWLNLIKSYRFICKHLSKSEEIFVAMCFRIEDDESPEEQWNLDVYRYDDDHKEKSGSESDSQIEASDNTLPVLHFELPPFDRPILQSLVGDCYGVMCLQNHYNIKLVNPALGEVKIIPIPATSDPIRDHCRFVGFGFDNTTTDFKVIRITGSHAIGGQHRGEVYSVRSNAWRKLDEIQIHMIENYSSSRCSTFFNGIVHWCVATDDQSCWRIITFNLATELFQIMEIPRGWCNNNPRANYSLRLFVLNQESLAFVSYIYYHTVSESQSQLVNVWIRNNHGIQETWTKLYSIGHLPQLRKPISFWKKDKLLNETKEGQLILYDLNGQHGSLVFDRSHNIYRYGKNRRLRLTSYKWEYAGQV